MKCFIIAFSIVCFVGCNNANEQGHAHHDHNNNASIPQTLSDSIYKSVMSGHDRGMAKTGELIRYKNLAVKVQDSIAKLKTKPAAQSATLDSVMHDLDDAKKLMDDWMLNFDPNKAGETEQEKTAYYTKEKEKVDTVEARINSSIERAKKALD